MTDIEAIAPSTQSGLQPLALRAMFWRPDFLAASPWLEHIPVAFWLVEAQRPRVIVELGPGDGVAYFAFCQAVDRLGLDTRCFAVAWPADGRDDAPAESALAALRDHNDARYSSFSRLVDGDRDEVLDQISDGTVDLLHVDGRHGHAALSLLLQQWQPKLSPRALVVLHHANSHGRRGGARRVVEELARTRPVFDFVQGEGLAIVGAGERTDALPARLFSAALDDGVRRSVQDVFSRLGRGCSEAWLAQVEQARARDLARQLAERQAELELARTQLAQWQAVAEGGPRPAGADTAGLERPAGGADAEREALERALRAARDELAEARRRGGGDAQAEVEALKAEVARLNAARQAVEEKEAVLLRLRTEAEKRAADEIRQLRAREESLQAEVASLTDALAAGRSAQSAESAEASRRADEERGNRLKALREHVGALMRALAPNPAAAAEPEGDDPESLLGALDRATGEVAQLRTHLQGARNRNRALEGERDQLAAKLQAATQRGDTADAAAQAAARRADELAAEWAAAARAHARERSDIAHRHETAIAELEGEVERLTALLAASETGHGAERQRIEELERLRHDEAERFEADAREAREAHEARVREFAARLAEAEAERDRLRAAHDEARNAERQAAAHAEALAGELEQRGAAVAAAQQAFVELQAELAGVRSELADAQADLAGTRGGLVEAQAALDAERARVAALRGEHEDLQRQHGESRAMLQRAAAMLKALKDEKDALARDHAAAIDAAAQAHAEALAAEREAATRELALAKANAAREAEAALAGQRAELEARAAAALASLGQRHAAELTAAVARHEAESAQQAAALAKSAGELEARFRETGTLSGLLLEAEAQADALRARLAAADAELAAAAEREARQRDLGAALAAALRSRDEALRQHEAELRARDAELERVRRSPSWRLTAPLRVIGRPFRAGDGAAEAPAEDAPAVDPHVALLRESPLLDAAWYLRTYPDVAAAGAEPAEHYLQFGAVEGRDPGPEFDTVGYLRANPDVAAAGLNPLVHYLLFGRDEGRAMR